MAHQMHAGGVNLVFPVSRVKNITSSYLKKVHMPEDNSKSQQITYIKQTVPVIAQALQKSKQGKNIQ